MLLDPQTLHQPLPRGVRTGQRAHPLPTQADGIFPRAICRPQHVPSTGSPGPAATRWLQPRTPHGGGVFSTSLAPGPGPTTTWQGRCELLALTDAWLWAHPTTSSSPARRQQLRGLGAKRQGRLFPEAPSWPGLGSASPAGEVGVVAGEGGLPVASHPPSCFTLATAKLPRKVKAEGQHTAPGRQRTGTWGS